MPDSILDTTRAEASQLSNEELGRYSRQLIVPDISLIGQRRLKASRVLCIGAGGLGSPAALYLAAAGVGTIGLVDFDRVERSNLHRQILHGTDDVGRRKLESASETLRQTNPNVELVLHESRFSAENATRIVADYDVVVDGSDNFATRYLSNDVCVWARKPNIYGSVFRFDGQVSVFAPHLSGPCYRCMFPEPPPLGAAPSCEEAGVLGVLPGVIGTLQATEAMKLILGAGETLTGRLLHFDALKMKFHEFNLRRDPDCPVCGDRPTIFEPIDYDNFCSQGAAGVGPDTEAIPVFSVQELKQKIDAHESVTLLDVREPFEYDIAHIAGAKLIPLGELEERLAEIDRGADIVIHCHNGVRSAHAVELLRQAGLTDVYNLVGGIDAWSREVDESVPRY